MNLFLYYFRTGKPIKYFVTENDSSDDNDFCDFTPPSKKIKETNKKKKSKRDHESKETIVSNDSPKDKSPKQRLSLEERKFQRELEMALELSATNKEPFTGFNKKKDDKENELEFFSPLRTTFAEVEVHPEPPPHDKDISSSKDSKLEIIDERGDDNRIQISNVDNVDGACVNKEIKIEVEKLDNIDQTTNGSETISPSLLNSNNNLGDVQNPKQKKERKKVNFIDDESDGFSENEIEESYKSETDESDYFPSPSKSKRKKEKKKKKKSKEKDLKPKKDIEKRKPLSVTQINTVVKSPKLSKDKDVSSRKKDINLSESSPKVFTPVAGF
ncbi:hypothetical protein Avbf_11029 [Armadillidium vulgare]|nr:hypothetical protein Avbf_11029 [Armadillidium vulgare]